MTTSHRPTFNSALGGASRSGVVSRQESAKDQIGFTQMKYRALGQASKQEMEVKDLRQELSLRESQLINEKKNALQLIEEEENKIDLGKVTLMIANSAASSLEKKTFDDEDVQVNYSDDEDELLSSDDGGDDDEDDDELELQRELQKIKEERAMAQAKREEEERALFEHSRKDSALKGNPLIDMDGAAGSARIKRRWNDDVVFRNQTRGEPETKKRFINDTIRNDFHRSFLKKFMQ